MAPVTCYVVHKVDKGCSGTSYGLECILIQQYVRRYSR